MNARCLPVAFVADATRIGGGEVSLLGLLQHLDRARYRPVFLCYGSGALTARLREMGIPVYTFERGSRIGDLFLAVRMALILRRERIALVHVNSLDIRAGLAARLAGARLLGHLRVIIPFTWVDRLFVRMANRVFAVSRAAIRAIGQSGTSLARGCSLLPNAVPRPVRRSTRPDCLTDLPEGACLIGAVGRLDPVKGIEYLIDALPRIRSRIPNACLIIVGEPGPYAAEQDYARSLKSRAGDLNLGEVVRFVGYRDDAPSIVAALDVLVVPSVRIPGERGTTEEGFGRVAVEAMAAGVPVVATNTGGLPEVLAHGRSGFLVEDRDASALASSIIHILADRDLYRKYSEAGRRRYEAHYTLSRHVQQVERVYASIA